MSAPTGSSPATPDPPGDAAGHRAGQPAQGRPAEGTPAGGPPALAVGLGAMHDTRTIVASVIDGCGKAAERARGLADRVGADGDRLMIAMGGGPPSEVRETGARNRDAAGALDEAATALQEAAIALRSFARRTS